MVFIFHLTFALLMLFSQDRLIIWKINFFLYFLLVFLEMVANGGLWAWQNSNVP